MCRVPGSKFTPSKEKMFYSGWRRKHRRGITQEDYEYLDPDDEMDAPGIDYLDDYFEVY